MVAGTPDINLLPTEEIEKAPLGKLLKWALTYGRYIVVVTELIVLLAFLSRFKLDRDITDLSEEISRKKNIITAAEPFENKVRQLQNRINKISAIESGSIHPDKTLDYITTVLPLETILDTVTVNGPKIIISGTTPTEAGLSTVVGAIRQNKNIQSLSVDKISRDASGVITFSLSIDLWL
ncbi:MAG: PilN domain-containing protein [Patescibacteria group bacterium]